MVEDLRPFGTNVASLPGVVGYMYTTWTGNFGSLRPYLALSGFGERSVALRQRTPGVLLLKEPRRDP